MEFRADFFTNDGHRVQGQEVVFPILAVRADPLETTCIGTGFFISNSGIFATAAHVVRDVLGPDGVQTAGLAICQFTPPDDFRMRRITQVAVHTVADVAIGATESLFERETGRLGTNKMLPLTGQIPNLGDRIATWAYPNSHANRTSDRTVIRLIPKLYVGTIKAEHRQGRDSVLLPGPCYETDMCIEGGTSGGPVMNEEGRVFAINSSSFDGAPVSYISHIQRIGGLTLRDCRTEDGENHDSITISALIERNHIPLHRG